MTHRATTSRHKIGVLALLAIALLAIPTPHSEAHHYFAIQPGALIKPTCTLDFVFRGADPSGGRGLFIGTAAHCVEKEGIRVRVPALGEFGTVAYRREAFDDDGSLHALDFALIEIDRDKYKHVDPSVRFWGGPTGIEWEPTAGMQTIHYGQGLGFHATEASRPRTGLIEYVKSERYWGEFSGWYVALHPINAGDSGSAVLTAEGKALGTLNLIAAAEKGLVSGPTMPLILHALKTEGWRLSLVTAPYSPPTNPTRLQQVLTNTVEHCVGRPIADDNDPDGCARVMQ